MRTFLFLVAALAAFLATAVAQPLPHPSTSPTISAAMAHTYTVGTPVPPTSPACPVPFYFMEDQPGPHPYWDMTTLRSTVRYASAVEDLSQPTAAPYAAMALVWTGFADFANFQPSTLPWADPWIGPPIGPSAWNPANYYALPGFWSPCDLTWINPLATTVALLPTHQDVGPVVGFPRYFVGWSMPSTHRLSFGAWYVCVQWVTLHRNGTLRLSMPVAVPTF
jgi:hypothetical protein